MAILHKLFSGRFVWAVAAAYVFVVGSIEGLIAPDDIKMIVGIVVTFYFMKDRTEEPEK